MRQGPGRNAPLQILAPSTNILPTTTNGVATSVKKQDEKNMEKIYSMNNLIVENDNIICDNSKINKESENTVYNSTNLINNDILSAAE